MMGFLNSTYKKNKSFCKSKKLFSLLSNTHNFFGFTLAEVLIVVGIVGIVAEITIPTIIQDTKVAQMKAGAKTAYTILSQASTMAATANGGSLVNICSNVYDNVCMKNYMAVNLLVKKDCGGTAGANSSNTPVTNGCWKTVNNLVGGANGEYENYAGLILQNGMLVDYRAHHADCTVEPTCGWVAVDVNGLALPNRQGVDTFFFNIAPNGSLSTMGTSASDCGTEAVQYLGQKCTYKYIYEN